MKAKQLSRESILNGHIQEMLERCPGVMEVMPDDERQSYIDRAIEQAPDRSDFWVFGYGSLIWNPAIHVSDEKTTALNGYHRAFCFWTKLGRGSDNFPGLMLGLEPGGECHGRCFKIASTQIESELDILFRREMISYAYLPTWVETQCNGEVIPALTFVVNPDTDRYCGKLELDQTVEVVARACGQLGRNCDYLFDLVTHLKQDGLPDPDLYELDQRVRSYQAIHNL